MLFSSGYDAKNTIEDSRMQVAEMIGASVSGKEQT